MKEAMMMEVIHPEIRVPDLVTHINQEVSRCQARSTPPWADGAGNQVLWEQIAAQLQRAEQHAYMGRSVPELKRLRGLTRWLGRTVARGFLFLAQAITKGQREFNVATVQAVRDLSDTVRGLEQAQQESLQHLEQVCREHREDLESTLHKYEAGVRRQEIALQQYQADLRAQEATLKQHQADFRTLAGALERQAGDWRTQELRLQKQETALHNLEADRRDQQAVRQQQATTLRDLECLLQQQTATVRNQALLLEQQATTLRDLELRLERQTAALGEQDGHVAVLEKALGQIKTSSHIQDSRIRLLLEETRRLPGPGHVEPLAQLAQERDHWLDLLYLTFEDQFRGSRAEIKSRLQVYLPRIHEAAQGADLLDVGCGRGEWLELMREEGFTARGVDLNRVMVEECGKRGLEVREGDALAYLRSLPDACLGVVTGFHIIEHLPWEVFLSFLDETVRVLKPGGVAIFETPNPENLLVASCTFWADPTHRKPLFPPTIQFLAEQRGLVNVEIWRLNQSCVGVDPLRLLPQDHELASRLNPLIELAKQRFFAAPDFAVVGSKVK